VHDKEDYLKMFQAFLKPNASLVRILGSYAPTIWSKYLHLSERHDEPFSNPFSNVLTIAWVGNKIMIIINHDNVLSVKELHRC